MQAWMHTYEEAERSRHSPWILWLVAHNERQWQRKTHYPVAGVVIMVSNAGPITYTHQAALLQMCN